MKKMIASLLMAALLVMPVAAAAQYIPSREHFHPIVVVNPSDDENPDWYGTIHNEDDDSIHEYIYVNGEEELVVHFLEEGEGDEDGYIKFADGEHYDDFDVPEEIKERLAEAEDELLNGDLTELIENFEEEWKNRTGAPIENAHIVKIFDACVDEDTAQHFSENKYIRFEVKIDHLDADKKIVVIQKERGSDKWRVVEHTMDENNEITIEMDICSVFAILADSAANPVVDDDVPQSPQTGVEADTAVYAAGALILLCGAMVFGKKAAKKN